MTIEASATQKTIKPTKSVYKNLKNYLPNFQSRGRQQIWLVLLVIVLGGGSALRLIGFDKTEAETHNKKNSDKTAPIVTLAPVQEANVPIYISALGSVDPSQSVTVIPQINGQLLKMFFKEGQLVKQGDLLAEIDPRPFEAQVNQYSGQLAKDAALLENAKIDLQRYKTLVAQDSVSRQTYEAQKWLVKQYEGTVKADQGQLDSAKVNLSFCKIIAPVTGRIGLKNVDPGSYVQTNNAQGLFVINSISPISIIFTIPEDQLPPVMKQLKIQKTLIVKAYNRGRETLLSTGLLESHDNQIDPTTGTIKLKASFTNQEEALFPNQFVNVDLHIKTLKNAKIISDSAVQYGPQGPYVYIVNKDHTVSLKPISIATTQDNNIVVASGLTKGQMVVTEGVDKLKDGISISLSAKIS